MVAARRVQSIAKAIASQCVHQHASLEEIFVVIREAATLPLHTKRDFLKIFQKNLKSELYRQQQIIEFSGEITKSDITQLEKSFSKKFSREIRFVTQEKPDLIAGIRVHIGDQRWEKSIRDTLNQLL